MHSAGVAVDIVEIHPKWQVLGGGISVQGPSAHCLEDAIVLAELLASGQPLAQALERFMARRFERCRMVVENLCKLGE